MPTEDDRRVARDAIERIVSRSIAMADCGSSRHAAPARWQRVTQVVESMLDDIPRPGSLQGGASTAIRDAVADALLGWSPEMGSSRLISLIALADAYPSQAAARWMLESLLHERFRGFPDDFSDIHLELLWKAPMHCREPKQMPRLARILKLAIGNPKYSAAGFLGLLRIDPACASRHLPQFLKASRERSVATAVMILEFVEVLGATGVREVIESCAADADGRLMLHVLPAVGWEVTVIVPSLLEYNPLQLLSSDPQVLVIHRPRNEPGQVSVHRLPLPSLHELILERLWDQARFTCTLGMLEKLISYEL